MASIYEETDHLQPQSSGLYPTHFQKGAQIELASGEIKSVEKLTVEDFRQSTELSPDLKLDFSAVDRISLKAGNTMTLVHFIVGNERLEITVEAPVEHPFLVYSKGWCSVNPEMSMQRYRLNCEPLVVGDVCASLTLKASSSDFGLASTSHKPMAYHGISAGI